MRTVLVAALLAAFAVPAEAAVVFETSGSFLAGLPTSFFTNACHQPFLDGVSSNCFELPAGLDGLPYAVAFHPFAVGMIGVCFFAADGRPVACGGLVGAVPQGAVRGSVYSLAGAGADLAEPSVGMRWTFTVTDA